MIEAIGSLLDVKEGLIIHGCNAQGVMGSGVAKAIRDTYPVAYEAYRHQYETKGLRVGQVIWARISMAPKLAIGNAITQEFFGRDPGKRYVDYDGVETAFKKIGKLARDTGLPVHYPRIGAGLGNGDWSVLSRIIDEALEGVTHTLWVPENEVTPKPSVARPRRP